MDDLIKMKRRVWTIGRKGTMITETKTVEDGAPLSNESVLKLVSRLSVKCSFCEMPGAIL